MKMLTILLSDESYDKHVSDGDIRNTGDPNTEGRTQIVTGYGPNLYCQVVDVEVADINDDSELLVTAAMDDHDDNEYPDEDEEFEAEDVDDEVSEAEEELP
jgi:hypothetical protein